MYTKDDCIAFLLFLYLIQKQQNDLRLAPLREQYILVDKAAFHAGAMAYEDGASPLWVAKSNLSDQGSFELGWAFAYFQASQIAEEPCEEGIPFA